MARGKILTQGRSKHFEVDGPVRELDELSRSVPSDPSELEAFFMEDLFPLLDLGGWVSLLLEGTEEGELLTFGGAAAALGAPRGAKGIAEWVSIGKVKGPVHRMVRGDGTPLGPRGGPVLSGREVSPILDRPPFSALARVQSAMSPLLKGGDGGRRRALCGLDISTKGGSQAAALVPVLLSGEVLEGLTSFSGPTFPYIPGFLFYKEAPHLMPLIRKAVSRGIMEDGILVLDGNGTLHPRGMGIACQLGMAMDLPSFGIAKRLLTGSVGPWAQERGVESAAIEVNGSHMGDALRKEGRLPIYVSRGHRTVQGECRELAVDMLNGVIPSPTRLAHVRANEARRSEP